MGQKSKKNSSYQSLIISHKDKIALSKLSIVRRGRATLALSIVLNMLFQILMRIFTFDALVLRIQLKLSGEDEVSVLNFLFCEQSILILGTQKLNKKYPIRCRNPGQGILETIPAQ